MLNDMPVGLKTMDMLPKGFLKTPVATARVNGRVSSRLYDMTAYEADPSNLQRESYVVAKRVGLSNRWISYYDSGGRRRFHAGVAGNDAEMNMMKRDFGLDV